MGDGVGGVARRDTNEKPKGRKLVKGYNTRAEENPRSEKQMKQNERRETTVLQTQRYQ